jgi:hypothetical protein
VQTLPIGRFETDTERNLKRSARQKLVCNLRGIEGFATVIVMIADMIIKNDQPFTIKVNLITLIKVTKKILKWRRQHIINSNKDVPEKPI